VMRPYRVEKGRESVSLTSVWNAVCFLDFALISRRVILCPGQGEPQLPRVGQRLVLEAASHMS
jgi:hypothetical protein